MDNRFSEYKGGVDVVIIGSSEIESPLPLGIVLVRPKGQILLKGTVKKEKDFNFANLIDKELIFKCVKLYTKEDFKRGIHDISGNASNYCSLITYRIPLNCISDGLKILETIAESMQVIVVA
jgi:threonine dehydrogenase-like Zn-dependent dehydrogenase